jgi:CBS domain-containing protein
MQVNAAATCARMNLPVHEPDPGTDVMITRHASDIVSHQNPLILPPTATVQQACRGMRDREVGAVLVTEGDRRLVGIFTGRDAVGRVLAEGRDAAATALSEVMTRSPDAIPPGKTAIEALRLMQDAGYRHLPVVAAGKVIGVISRSDFRGLENARLDDETGLWERI